MSKTYNGRIKGRSHNQAYRLSKQVDTVIDDEPKIRNKSYADQLTILSWYENPERSFLRSWKSQNKLRKQWEKKANLVG